MRKKKARFFIENESNFSEFEKVEGDLLENRESNFDQKMVCNKLILSFLLTVLLLNMPFLRTLTAQTVLFQTEFNNTTIDWDSPTGAFPEGEVNKRLVNGNNTGNGTLDNWTDLPNAAQNIGDYKLKFGHRTEYTDDNDDDTDDTDGYQIICGDMGATIETTDPETGAPNNCMKFEIFDHPTFYNNNCYTMANCNSSPVDLELQGIDDARGRVQAEIHLSNPSAGGLTNFHYSNRLFIPEDFGWMLEDDQLGEEYQSIIIGEIWNVVDFSYSSSHDNFRINYSLHKLEGEQAFRIRIKGEPRVAGGWGNPDWLYLSEPVIGNGGNNMTVAELNEWLRLEVYYIEGDMMTGKIAMKMNGVPILDITANTMHQNDQIQDGIRHFHPQKLYVNAVNVQKFMTRCNDHLHVYWDDFMIERDFNPHEHDIICPIPAGCASIVDGNSDVEQPVPGDVDLNNNDLDLLHDKYVGLQFTGMTIPQYATVVDAHIQFKSKFWDNCDPSWQDCTVETTIYGEQLNQGQFNNELPAPFSVSNLPNRVAVNDQAKTSVQSSVYWPILPWAASNLTTYYQRTPNLNEIVYGIMSENDNGNQLMAGDILSFIFKPNPNNVTSSVFQNTQEYDGQRAAMSKETMDETAKLCVLYDYLASGNIKMWCGDQIPIPGVFVDIAGVSNSNPCGLVNSDAYDATTDLLGNFRQHICEQVANYQLTPIKENDTRCGISSLDLVLIRQHILQSASLPEGHARIAADANGSNSITSYDLHFLAKEVLVIPQELTSPYIPWKFHDGSPLAATGAFGPPPVFSPVIARELPGINNQVNFEAIKTGDVNCDCISDELTEFTGEDVVVIIEDINAVKDEVFDVKFRVENFESIEAYQLGIDFDSEKLEYQNVSEGDLNQAGTSDNFGTSDAEEGEVRHLWLKNDGSDFSDLVVDTTLNDESNMFTMTFKAKEDVSSLRSAKQLSGLLGLNDKVLTNMAIGKEGIQAVRLKFVPEGTFKPSVSPIKEVFCYPNPTSNTITFDVALVRATTVKLQVFDPLGRQLIEKEQALDYGLHELLTTDVKAWQEGLYFYTIIAGGIKRSGKFVKQ